MPPRERRQPRPQPRPKRRHRGPSYSAPLIVLVVSVVLIIVGLIVFRVAANRRPKPTEKEEPAKVELLARPPTHVGSG